MIKCLQTQYQFINQIAIQASLWKCIYGQLKLRTPRNDSFKQQSKIANFFKYLTHSLPQLWAVWSYTFGNAGVKVEKVGDLCLEDLAFGVDGLQVGAVEEVWEGRVLQDVLL